MANITDIQFYPCVLGKGLIGFLSFTLNDIVYLSGIGVRQKPDGDIALYFPEKSTKSGKRYFYHKIVSDEIINEVIRAVLPIIDEQKKDWESQFTVSEDKGKKK